MARANAPSGKCTTCLHPERGRIDYLAATGAPIAPLATQFGLKKDALHRHLTNHVTDSFRRSVKVGPLQNEENLRKLCAESGESILEHLQGLRALLTARLMVAYEAGADSTLAPLARELRQTGELMARLTKELLPPSNDTHNYTVHLNYYAELERDMLAYAREHPEAQPHFVAFFRGRVSQAPMMDVTPRLAHA